MRRFPVAAFIVLAVTLVATSLLRSAARYAIQDQMIAWWTDLAGVAVIVIGSLLFIALMARHFLNRRRRGSPADRP